MGIYQKYFLPKLIATAMRDKPMARERKALVPQATGVVLELGIGSGENLPYYTADQVAKLYALEPAVELVDIAQKRFAEADLSVQPEMIIAGAEAIPLDNDSVDTVVLTYTMCSIGPLLEALAEIRRVLKPQGAMLFSEHGQAPDANIAKWQNRINPLWGKIAGGCQLNLDIPTILTDNGFSIKDLDQHYLPGPKVLRYNYRGTAAVR